MQNMFLGFLLILLIAGFGSFLIVYGLTYLIRRYALAKSLIDIPNARSSHSIPTPRGGGLSIVLFCLVPQSAILFLWVKLPQKPDVPFRFYVFALLVAQCLVAGIGFWDDHGHISARWRLLVHFSAAALLLWCFPILLPSLSFFDFQFNNTWLLNTLCLFGLVWLINLYNFMDGIDGIASIEAVTVLLSAAILLFITSNPRFVVMLPLLCSVLGFLVWNLPPAKIFMGDACSGFLGFSLGLLALASPLHIHIGYSTPAVYVNLWTWLILLGVFITDATFTLIKRILNKEIWYEAHSSHAYQHYARQLIRQFQQQGFDSHDARTQSHRRVNFHMTLINIFWLFPLAAVATYYPYWAFLITVLAYLPLIFIAHHLNAGKPQ